MALEQNHHLFANFSSQGGRSTSFTRLVIAQGNSCLPGERDSTSDFQASRKRKKREGGLSCARLARVRGSAAPAPHRSRGKELESCSVRPGPSLPMHLPLCLLSCCIPVQNPFPAFPSLFQRWAVKSHF